MDVVFEAPGPGHWALDRSHMPAGCTPLVQSIMEEAEPAGMRRVFRELGAPLDTIEMRFVHGYMYSRVRPLIGADKPAARPPPRFLMKLGVRLHPEMRRRAKTAAAVLEKEPWRQVIHDWHHGMKDRIQEGNLALQDVDLTVVDEPALMAHVRACVDNCLRNWELHFWLHGYDLGPLGRYVYEADERGAEPAELLSLLEGASPSTTGPAREGAAIRRMVAEAGAEPATLDELKAVSPEVHDAVDRYLRTRAWVLFSRYDVDGITLGERADLAFASIMAGEERDVADEVAARTAAVRDRIPAPHRERFDEVLRQAREAMDLRDENGPTTAEWPLGLLRRALLEVGARMVAAGRGADRTLATELRREELSADRVLDLPDAGELELRRALRAAQRNLDPPRTLGPEEPPPPDGVLPGAMGELTGMVQIVVRFLGMDGTVGEGLHGTGIGTTAVTAKACVAISPEDALDRLEPGDVLVVAATTPAFNLVLSLAGGVVTAEGGPMSHAAVLARELGIPAVVGAHAALTDIPDGAMVEVDPVAGEVRLVQ